MERDIRRDRGQWRGCHSFKDIINEADASSRARRNGGLKMGHTYYYYYELDGTSESHDPSLPSTTCCPYLPGQKVNTLQVPVETASRTRSASVNSARGEDFMTMNPDDKFITPRAPPPVPGPVGVRLGSAPNFLSHKRSARSLSPTPLRSWSPRRLFTRRTNSSQDMHEAQQAGEEERDGDRRSTSPSGGSQSRDISPESLRRFLVDDSLPVAVDAAEDSDRPSVVIIPDDIAEENDDDDNFATSAATENMLYTGLSPPPPLQRGQSSTTITQLLTNAASQVPAEEEASSAYPEPPTREPPMLPGLSPLAVFQPKSHFSFSSASSASSTLMSPRSPDDPPSFYNSESEDDDVTAAHDDEGFPFPSIGGMAGGPSASFARSLTSAFSGYRLPATEGDKLTAGAHATAHPVGSPALIARNGSDLPVGNASLLAAPIASGLDDLVNELGWMADVINGKTA